MPLYSLFNAVRGYLNHLIGFGGHGIPAPLILESSPEPSQPSTPMESGQVVKIIRIEPIHLQSQTMSIQNKTAIAIVERPQVECRVETTASIMEKGKKGKTKVSKKERTSKTNITKSPPVICAVTRVEPVHLGIIQVQTGSNHESKVHEEQPQAACSSKKEEDHPPLPMSKSNMAAVKDVVSLYQLLKAEWAKKPVHLEKCGELLTKLKVGLTYLMFLPTSNTTASQQELLLARDILEIGAQWSIAVKDIPSFERYMAQLKCYYLDYRDQLAESAFKYQLLGLNLLFLLSQNRVAEFHTELELLPSDQIQTNVYIRHPLSLEQYLMEGSYNKIFLAKGNVPAESYNFFMDILLDTIRNEIAACLEKAYDKISLKEATRMLNLPNQKAIKDYGEKKNWTLKNDNFFYFNTVEAKPDNVLPSSELAEQAINYARELEMIV